MALQTKTYTQSSNGFTLELTLVEQSNSTAGNSSTLSYTQIGRASCRERV